MPDHIFSGKYEVQQEIAQGAMGIVYKALDQKLNRVVALKVVHPHLTSDTSFLQRFLREARAMARLQHDNIVTIYSVEQDQGTQFMVMEYFPGTNLHGRMQPNTGLPVAQALSITHQIAKALSYAHAHGIIHRDVKPANVLVGPNDHVKLTDFGIAAALDEAPLTTAGQLIGTLLYMSPEQAKDAGLDGRSDLYSLGLMLYEMLTGTHPRRGLSNTAVLGMLANEAASPTLSFSSEIPSNVQTLVKDLLRYRPIERVKDAQQLIDRLDTIETGRRSMPRFTQQPNALVDDRTICELPEATPAFGSDSSQRGQPLRPSREKQPGLSGTALAALAFGAITAIAIGVLAWNSFLSPPQPKSSATTTRMSPSSQAENQGSVTAVATVPQSVSPPPQVVQLLRQLQQSVANKDFRTVDRISIMSEGRRSWLEDLFRNFKTIDTSVGPINDTMTEVTAFLSIDKLLLPDDSPFSLDPSFQRIPITIPREGDGWGKIRW
ncbi:MAG: serine/threonine-protein kinase [Nitrospira sp.]|nr:serine/threonine protein kinase [Nitrospira sp.]